MSARRAEQRHGRVADVLVDHPAVPIDGRVDDGEETLEQSMDFLGVELRRELRIADKVTEHDSDGTSVADAGAWVFGGSGSPSPIGRPQPPQKRSEASLA